MITLSASFAGNIPAQTIRDVAYGKDHAQTFDAWLPEGRTSSSTPALILIHGGAWVNGDKADFRPYVDSFQKRFPNYAIFNINYRLVTFSYGNLYPTQENDIKQAVEFINNKREEYHISDKFILLGASAGSNLALLQAYKQPTPKIKAVIDFFGPSDMSALYQSANDNIRTAMEVFMNGTPSSNATNYTNASPVNFVTAQSPPTLILYGGRDRMIPASQHSALQQKLEQMGVANKIIVYPSYGHGWYGERLTDSFDQIGLFLEKYGQ